MRGLKQTVAMVLGIAICLTAGLVLNVVAYAEVDPQDLARAVKEEVNRLEKQNPELARELANEYREYTREKPGYERSEIAVAKIDRQAANNAKMIVEKPNIAAVHIDKIDKLAVRDDMKQMKEESAIRLSAAVENPHVDGEQGNNGNGGGGGVIKEPEKPVEKPTGGEVIGEIGGGGNTGKEETPGGGATVTPKGGGVKGK